MKEELQVLFQNGTTYTEVLNITTFEDDNEKVEPLETSAGTMTTNNQPLQYQPPSSLQLSKKQTPAAEEVIHLNQHCFQFTQTPAAEEVIHLNQHCFQFTRLGPTRSTDTVKEKKQRSVRTNTAEAVSQTIENCSCWHSGTKT